MAHEQISWIERDTYSTIRDDKIVTSWTNSNYETFTTLGGDYTLDIEVAKNTSGTAYVKSNTFDVKPGSKYRICLNAIIHAGAIQAPKIIDDTTGAAIHHLAANLTVGHHEYIFETTHTVKATCRVIIYTADTSANFGIENFTMEDLTNRSPYEKDYNNSITCYPLLIGFAGAGDTLSILGISDPLPDSFQGSYDYTILINENRGRTRRASDSAPVNANMYVQPIHTPVFPETGDEKDIKTKIETWVGTWPTGFGTTDMGNPDAWHLGGAISDALAPVGNNFSIGVSKDGGFAPHQNLGGDLGTEMKTSASIAKKRILVRFGRSAGTATMTNQVFKLTIVKNESSRNH